MPAWMTSELRELVWVPMASSASRMTTSRPCRASARATARPTTPAPSTTASTLSTEEVFFDQERAHPAEGRGGRQGPRRALEEQAERGADDRADGELACAHDGRGGAGAVRKRAERGRRGVGHDERSAAHVG